MLLSGSVTVALPNNDGCEDLRIECEMGDSESCYRLRPWKTTISNSLEKKEGCVPCRNISFSFCA